MFNAAGLPMTRRELLGVSSLGFGQIALAHLLAGTSEAAPTPIYNDLRARAWALSRTGRNPSSNWSRTAGPARWICSIRNPCWPSTPASPTQMGSRSTSPANTNTLLPTPFEFKQRGECGMDISEALPHQAEIVDKLCFIRSMHTEAQQPLRGLEHAADLQDFCGSAGHGRLGQLRTWHRKPEPSRIRGLCATRRGTRSGAGCFGPTASCQRSTKASSST